MNAEVYSLKIKALRKQNNPKQKNKFKKSPHEINLAYVAAKAAEDKKGENILLLDVSKLTLVADYFMIVTAKSSPQIDAIAKNIEENLSALNLKPVSKEGTSSSNWIILDFGNLVVHIMQENERNYYKLERFWSNGLVVNNKLWKKAS
jgi:ribosome-associated protein